MGRTARHLEGVGTAGRVESDDEKEGEGAGSRDRTPAERLETADARKDTERVDRAGYGTEDGRAKFFVWLACHTAPSRSTRIFQRAASFTSL